MNVFVVTGCYLAAFRDDPEPDDALAVGNVYATPEAAMADCQEEVTEQLAEFSDPEDAATAEAPPALAWTMTRDDAGLRTWAAIDETLEVAFCVSEREVKS